MEAEGLYGFVCCYLQYGFSEWETHESNTVIERKTEQSSLLLWRQRVFGDNQSKVSVSVFLWELLTRVHRKFFWQRCVTHFQIVVI